jgi:PHD/YefM family antitoxin component YafN of YafNO toxin-antitoxin module
MTHVSLEEASKTLPAIAAKGAAGGQPVRVSLGRGRRSVVIVSAVELENLRARAEAAGDDERLTGADLRAVRRGLAEVAAGDTETLEEYRAGKR